MEDTIRMDPNRALFVLGQAAERNPIARTVRHASALNGWDREREMILLAAYLTEENERLMAELIRTKRRTPPEPLLYIGD